MKHPVPLPRQEPFTSDPRIQRPIVQNKRRANIAAVQFAVSWVIEGTVRDQLILGSDVPNASQNERRVIKHGELRKSVILTVSLELRLK